ncbi:MAG TPA: nucleoside deaminase [Desulfobacteraceae bacterium]|nr:nucleoside deaminase [Desulfobacteraceae bacterium]
MNGRDTFFMRQAIELAERGMAAKDGGPFGAVIVRGDAVIGRGWNRVLRTNDPTAHAEIVAIRDACEQTGSYWLEGCHLYVSCEPCPMCLAAVYWARMASLTFAADRKDAAAIEFDDDLIYREVCRPAGERILPIRRCLRDDAVQVMHRWPSLAAGRRY